MRKFGLLMLAAVCCLALATACDDDEYKTGCPPDTDKSLAGSVSFFSAYRILEMEASYDGSPLTYSNPDFSTLYVGKPSDNELSLYYSITLEEGRLTITIPKIPITGKRYDVAFDHSSNDTLVALDGIEYTSDGTEVKGWIKRPDMLTKCSPFEPDFTCEISSEFIVNSKPLKLRITSISH